MGNGGTISRWVFAVVVLLIGAVLSVGGGRLVALGGSPYYLLTGTTLVLDGILILRKSRFAGPLYLLWLLATLLWSIGEAGLEPWALLARLGGPALLGAWYLGPAARRVTMRLWRTDMHLKAAVAAVMVAAVAVLVFAREPLGDEPRIAVTPGSATEWTAFGGTEAGARYSTLTQITADNVHRLRLAWTYRTGDLPNAADAQSIWTFEATPLKVGDTLYLCTAHSIVHAIDAETGQRRWVFDPHVRQGWAPNHACRGVAFYRAEGPVLDCPERIIAPTIDGRLMALDAHTGQLCPSFGSGGQIDLLKDLGPYPLGYAFPSSPPAIVGGKAVIGGFVMDGTMVGAPSGVIRAFDAVTGQLAWAWDMGRPDLSNAPGPGETYTPGTPNAWPPFSADEKLGLVYVPLGNATPDFYAGHRSEAAETYGTALVALDVKTGQPRWHFQMDHHDLWDHDLPAQPSLIDFPTDGGTIPAVIQPTKRGELFVLDRRTGTPLVTVAEKPVPQGAEPDDYTAPTQPYSTGMPSYAGPDLSEARMWGMTPLDQLWCRIRFRELRYQGQFTPPSVQGSLSYPGSAGIFSWGGVAIDEDRQILIANTVHSPFVTRLIPRAVADTIGLSTPPSMAPDSAIGRESLTQAAGAHAGLPQVGTPYAALALPFLSPLGIPCSNPPWGQISAIDLKTQLLLWKKPFGTSIDNGPFGWHFGLPLPIGVPSAGGAVSLRSGLFLIAASQDRYIRAYETSTGRELWRARLPAGGQATPITYLSGSSGRQFVVVAAGGHGGLATAVGDYVLGYALR